MELVSRDYKILKEVYRWRFCLGRHVKTLCDFTGARATDRRLKLLVEAEHISRKKVLYGVPYIYQITSKGKRLIGAKSNYQDKIDIDRIVHQMAVLDCVCYFKEQYGLPLSRIVSEKELHSEDGFSNRNHKPDFVVYMDNAKTAVEIELTLKSKYRFENNVRENYLNYDRQIWVIPRNQKKVASLLLEWETIYGNIEIKIIEDMTKG